MIDWINHPDSCVICITAIPSDVNQRYAYYRRLLNGLIRYRSTLTPAVARVYDRMVENAWDNVRETRIEMRKTSNIHSAV